QCLFELAVDRAARRRNIGRQPPRVHDEERHRHERDQNQYDGKNFSHNSSSCVLVSSLVRPEARSNRVRASDPWEKSTQYGNALNVKLTAFVSPAPTVTSCVCVPYCSCHAVTVYFPAGSPFRLNAPSGPVTA